MKESRSTLACLVLAIAAVGCVGGASTGIPNLGTLYSKAARYHGLGRNPIVVIPGILGSRLVDGASGRVLVDCGLFQGLK
ncbi:MAG: hypothetical protein KC466_03315, partial [Myxococcales bacterium]|nr:hypothetical protein [Myxococcales bacterium]